MRTAWSAAPLMTAPPTRSASTASVWTRCVAGLLMQTVFMVSMKEPQCGAQTLCDWCARLLTHLPALLPRAA